MKRLKITIAKISNFLWTNKYAPAVLWILADVALCLFVFLTFKFRAYVLPPEVDRRLNEIIEKELTKVANVELAVERPQPASRDQYIKFLFDLKLCPPANFELPANAEYDYVRLNSQRSGPCQLKEYRMTAAPSSQRILSVGPTDLLGPTKREVLPSLEEGIFVRLNHCSLEIYYPSGCAGKSEECSGKHSIPLRAQVAARALFNGTEYGGIKSQHQETAVSAGSLNECGPGK